jgi:hypothetical protein
LHAESEYKRKNIWEPCYKGRLRDFHNKNRRYPDGKIQ